MRWAGRGAPKDDQAGTLTSWAMITATAAALEQGFDRLGQGHPTPTGGQARAVDIHLAVTDFCGGMFTELNYPPC